MNRSPRFHPPDARPCRGGATRLRGAMRSLVLAAAARLRFLVPKRFRRDQPVVAVVRLSGAIGAVMPLRTGLSVAGTAPALDRAFAIPGLKAVALIVNS